MYTIRITRAAQKELDSLSSVAQTRVRAAIDALADDPRPNSATQLRGSTAWRMRVGDYRVVYDIDDIDLVVTVIRVGHRRDVYR
jgi:mRNA interferase RelE/StbE